MSEDTKLQALIESEGFENLDDFLQEYAYSNVVPGICMNDGCDYTTNVEPDQNRGWCGSCNTKTVQSGLMLGGIV